MLGCGKRKKGIAAWAVTVVLLAFIGAFLVGVPQMVLGWANQLIGVQPNCNDDPYNANCMCITGQRKISVPWIGVPRWHCENIELLILDPESPSFKTEAISFVKTYLEYHCGSVCTDLECGEICEAGRPDLCTDEKYMTAVYGYGSSGERIVNIECMINYGSTRKWQMNFFVESATDTPRAIPVMAQSNYCLDPAITQRCEPVIEVVTPTLLSLVGV